MPTRKRTGRNHSNGRFITGNIGGGRKPGSRNKLGEAFIEALSADFEQHGEAVIAAVRIEKPNQYLKVIASILPKEIAAQVTHHDENLRILSDKPIDEAEWERCYAPDLGSANSNH